MKLHVLLMIGLMLTAPMVFSLSVSISGKDGIENYIREDDILTVNAKTTIPGYPDEAIATQRIVIESNGTQKNFDTCNLRIEYDCVYSEKFSGKEEKDYTIKVLDQDGKDVFEAKETLTVDNNAPIVLELEVSSKIANNFSIDVKIQDFAFRRGDTSSCAGIKNVEFYLQNKKIGEVKGTQEQCELESSFDFSVEKSGKFDVCAKAYDFFNQDSQKCIEVSFDAEPPSVKRFGFVDVDRYFLSHLSTKPMKLYPVVEITDLTGLEKVMANLAPMNGVNAYVEPLVVQGDFYIFDEVTVTSDLNCNATIRSIDKLGNQMEMPVSCGIVYDEISPNFLRIETDYKDVKGNSIVGKRSDIRVILEEGGVGLNKKKVFADFKSIGLDVRQADKCIDEANLWMCTFFNITPAKDGEFFIKVNAVDDLGNIMPENEDLVIVNLDSPIIDKIEHLPRFVTSLNTLDILIDVTTPIDITPFATAHGISDGERRQGNCEILSED
ncbi:hypothetical protein ACFLZN_00145 [Nanoarchaeota archaeon]